MTTDFTLRIAVPKADLFYCILKFRLGKEKKTGYPS